MIKKSVNVIIFIAWAFFTAVLVAGLVFYQNSNTLAVTTPSAVTSAPSAAGSPVVTLTSEEIAKHNKSTDCWLIINQNVYDVTTYMNQHPGNAGTILPYCGQDGTVAFDTKGRPSGDTHSSYANSLLADYLLGAIGQTISGSTTNSATATLPSTVKTSVPSDQAITLTVQEIAQHNSNSDCWLIINQNVYNVTTYLNQHPGNASTILPYCGQEATTAFDTKGRANGQPHSGSAASLLSAFMIGTVGQSVSPSAVNPSVTVPSRNEDRDD
jgi:cytochrome b involved in lipid metabolism